MPDGTRDISAAPRRRRLSLTWESLGGLVYRYRVYLLFLMVFGVMAAIAPNFLSGGNFANILKAGGINLPAGVGFSIVMIAGQLDLSVGSTMTLGGMMVVGLQPHLGWTGSFCVAIACGLAAGLVNGLLVAKARINSFIVTLGTMIIIQNIVYIYCEGGTIPAKSFELGDWWQRPIAAWLLSPQALANALENVRAIRWTLLRELVLFFLAITPQIVLPFVVMGILAVFLRWTPVGKGFYLLGGNPQTAWYSGLRVDSYVAGAFVISGGLSALGGAVFAMSQSNANPTVGEKSLMTIVAAVIIGGTSMQGGKGSLVGTAVALVALAGLINGLNCRGAGFEVQLMASGLVLALIILYDAYSLYRREKKRGQRLDLLKELRQGGAA